MERIRIPTDEEKKQMSEAALVLEKQVQAALQAWGSAVFSIGFAAGVEKALTPDPNKLVVPIRPKLVT